MLVVILPLSAVLTTLLNVSRTVLDRQDVVLNLFVYLRNFFPNLDLTKIIGEQITMLGSFISTLLVGAVRGFTSFLISLTILYFVLYFLLVDHKNLSHKFHKIIPFNKKHTKQLVQECKRVTYATIVATGLIALIQGILITLAFLVFDIQGAFFWGFITAFLSFLPVVGPTLIWLPGSVFLFIQHRIGAGIALMVWGILLTNIENFLRPMLQKRVGKIHPLISLIGVFIGIPLFGLLGIVIGPLLLSYFLLIIRMVREEYF
jgi:predicted PurR-regulated permease PerM